MSEMTRNEEGRAEQIGAPAMSLEKSVEFDIDRSEDAGRLSSETPSKREAMALDAHAAAGHDLIPIEGKRPVGNGWRRLPAMSLPRAKARFAAGANVGVRLRPVDLVVDVDPRHFHAGDDPLARLQADFALPEAPVVLTGGGGRHLYFRKPEGMMIAGRLAGYDGIDFKSAGGQVVSAGSIHVDTGRPYCLDDDALALSLSEAPEATAALLDAIGRHRAGASSSSVSSDGEIEPEQLAKLLSKLDVTSYNGRHDDWVKIMMACHRATGGTGVDEFVTWSLGDLDYADDEVSIRGRWAGYKPQAGGVTIRTLLKAVSDAGHGATVEEVMRAPPEEDFPDDVEEVPVEALSAERKRDAVDADGPRSRSNAVWNDWVWVAEPYQFVRRDDTRKFRAEQWKSLFANLKPDGDVLNAIWKNNLPMRKFETLVYLPEAGEFPDGEKGGRYNIWRRSGVEAVPGDVSVFLDHMAYLFPDEADRNHVLDYLALLVQRPAEKVHFALLIRGSQGTGKSWIGNLMERIVGRRNVVRPSNDEVTSRWTAWMEGAQLAVIEELMTLGRKEVANRLKPAITDATLRIEEKGCSIYSIPNCLNFLCFTNHEDALPIEHGDRRWLVVFSPARKREPAYYEKLFAYLDEGGAAHVKHWLSQRSVALKAHGVAPSTQGKETMRRLGMGDAEAFLLDLFEAGQAPFDFDLVRLDDVVDAVPAALRGRSNLRARVSKLLKEELGAVQHTRYCKADRDRPAVQLWSVREHESWERAGAAARIDAFKVHRSGLGID